ncbi:MAG: hypothetical protein ACTSSI_03725 [Candidatus Helarchaeota archaeon]
MYQRVYYLSATYLEIEELLKAYLRENEWTYTIEFQTFKAFRDNLKISIKIEEQINMTTVQISGGSSDYTIEQEQEIIEIIADIGDYLEGFFISDTSSPQTQAVKNGCPICGKALRRGVIYCPNCGALVK